MTDPKTGKEFAPDHHADDKETDAATRRGSGKQFAPGVRDPDDERATATKGSGKGFSPSVQDPDIEDDTEHGKGSGKQFRPERDDL